MSNASYFLSTPPDLFEATNDIWAISDEVTRYIELVTSEIISGFAGLFGIVTNVINIIVFFRLGFRETINISLFAISLTDLGSSIFLVWIAICSNPYVQRAGADIFFNRVEYFTGSYPRSMFGLTNAYLTVFVTIERFMCIAFPLKAKALMTRKMVISIIVAIHLIIFGSMIPNYFTVRFGWVWMPMMNRSMLSFTLVNSDTPYVKSILMIQTVYAFAGFSAISVFTILFARKLNERNKWRQSISNQTDMKMFIRDQQIIKTVTGVAVIFIVSNTPYVFTVFLLIAYPDGSSNIILIAPSVTLAFGSVNTVANIFVYFKMMSKYRAVFYSLFKEKKASTKDC